MILLLIPFGDFPLQDNKPHSSELPESQPIQLTTEEQAWLDTQQLIRIAFDGYFPPYSFIAESGVPFDYEMIFNIGAIFLLVLFILLLWIGQVDR